MKINIFLIGSIIMALLVPSTSFSAQTDKKDGADRTLAALEPQRSSAAREMEKADPDTFSEDDFFVNETQSEPVATVSDSKKAQGQAHSFKTKTDKAETVTLKTSSKDLFEEKTAQDKTKQKTPMVFNSAEIQKRWAALFSKEIAPDSISYTVKSGDSLYVIARKNHTTVDFIKKINDLKSDDIYPGTKLKIHTAPFSILVDKSENTLILYSNSEAVKKYPVATGKKNSTPVGEFQIKDKLVNPTWFKAGAILPPGSPENALGTRWLGFDKPAYGIHGTIEPKSIGTQASEGCIRMLNEDVEEIYSMVPIGTKVTVQD